MLNGYTNVLYWSFGLTLVLMEYLNKPKKFYKYKIQQEKSALNDSRKLKKVNNEDFANHG